MKLEHPLIEWGIRRCVYLNFVNIDIIFGGVPSYIGIRGNEKADCCQVCSGLASCQGWCTYNDFKHKINQGDWNGVVNKLHSGSRS